MSIIEDYLRKYLTRLKVIFDEKISDNEHFCKEITIQR